MLPKSWQIESLGSLLEESPQNGYSPNCPEEPTGRWVLGLGALTGNGLDFSQVKPAPINDILVDRFQVHPGDFLISRSNTLDKVGRSALYRGGLEECSYPDLMMRFRVGSSRVDLDYLDAYLRSERVMKYIQRSATGTSGSMKKINQAVVEGIPIVLPSLIEQRQIAAILSIWDEAIGKTERLIEGKEKILLHIRERVDGLFEGDDKELLKEMISFRISTRIDELAKSKPFGPGYSVAKELPFQFQNQRIENLKD